MLGGLCLEGNAWFSKYLNIFKKENPRVTGGTCPGGFNRKLSVQQIKFCWNS